MSTVSSYNLALSLEYTVPLYKLKASPILQRTQHVIQ